MSESPKQYPLRLPPHLYERIQSRSVATGRSMNAEILAMLEEVLDDPKAIDAGALALEARRALGALREAEYEQRKQQEKLAALQDELRGIYGDEPDGVDPLTYALRLSEEYYERRRLRGVEGIIDRHEKKR